MMRKIILSVAGMVLAFSCASASDNLLIGGDGEDAALAKKWGPETRQNTEQKKSGAGSIQTARREWIQAPELIAIDPSKSYKLSAFVKTADGQKASALIGVRFYGADKKEIGPLSVLPVPGTAMVLAADAKKGDATIKLPASWARHPSFIYGLAFNTRDDLSDLPNAETALLNKVDAEGTGCVVTLSEPLPRDYPVGTKVRIHRYVDYPGVTVTVMGDWTECSMTFSGESDLGAPQSGKFWKGSRYVRVNMFSGVDRKPDNPAMFFYDDVTFMEVVK